ncbi:hypothetical protein ACVHNB_38660 [Streptomyces sp. YJ-C3]
MHLVHIHLGPHPDGLPFPAGTDVAGTVVRSAAPAATVRHVSVHTEDGAGPVIGLYLLAPEPAAAGTAARIAWWSAVAARPELGGWPFLRAEPAPTLS